eukprot:gnl/MRDRNA2_/MRDRNA2_413185_c0_seq1.p1 gnl/MRDRNA2_/MRDRNA2_413185_c0~~gnl/MRDRNA2_/MRDRNA2_413185_c0_seq1.p1  ORF type:complete len:162 (+),score=32.85 gnl/MRDRNA2_/MRDRNA2_413185_c0_seq1:40-486(+)
MVAGGSSVKEHAFVKFLNKTLNDKEGSPQPDGGTLKSWSGLFREAVKLGDSSTLDQFTNMIKIPEVKNFLKEMKITKTANEIFAQWNYTTLWPPLVCMTWERWILFLCDEEQEDPCQDEAWGGDFMPRSVESELGPSWMSRVQSVDQK